MKKSQNGYRERLLRDARLCCPALASPGILHPILVVTFLNQLPRSFICLP